MAIILQSRHDLEVRSLISRMRRLAACAQGAKRSDSKASMSALGWLHQEGGAWQCGAVSRSASGSKHVQGRSASESAHAESTLDRRARVEHHSASRGGIACHAGRGEGSASGGSFLCGACRVLLRCVHALPTRPRKPSLRNCRRDSEMSVRICALLAPPARLPTFKACT